MALPKYTETHYRIWHYVYLFICGCVFFFLIAPLLVIFPLSFNAEEFLVFSLLLNVNLPDLLTVWMSLNKPISWNIENPFNLTIAKLNKVRGRLSKNLPPKANKIAKNTEPKKINLRNFFDIFFEDVFAINFNIK